MAEVLPLAAALAMALATAVVLPAAAAYTPDGARQGMTELRSL